MFRPINKFFSLLICSAILLAGCAQAATPQATQESFEPPTPTQVMVDWSA
jgi:PBP1b-binding outer membrane lipoprotein LpoB